MVQGAFYPEDELFLEAVKLWDLDKLYIDIGEQKQRETQNTTTLTSVEKVYLRGLLCGYSPKKIAETLHRSSNSIAVALTRGLYRYVEALTNRESNSLSNWKDVPKWLEVAGYKMPHYHHDWGEAPEISAFYGRTNELNQLQQWISKKQYSLVAILGIAGIGKTTLAVKLANNLQGEFEYIIWRNLRHDPPLKQLLVELILFLSHQQSFNLPEDINALISSLIKCLQEHRCLIVLDDAENILRPGALAGYYQANYEDYGQLLRRVAQEKHQSALLLISWEKFIQLELLEPKNNTTASLTLQGLPTEEAEKILVDNGLFGNTEEWETLITRYRGNPLALNLVATTIEKYFNGNVSKFLSLNEVFVPEPIRLILIAQLNRLDQSERDVIRYLGTSTTPVSREQLRQEITISSDSKLINVLQSLQRRSLIETFTDISQTFFTLSPLISSVILSMNEKEKR